MTPALLAFARAGFARHASYRTATVAGAFTNSAFGLIKASIIVGAVGAGGGAVAGYSASAASTYAWTAQALLAPVLAWGANDLALRVRTGDIAVDLARPVDLQASMLAADLGRAAYALLPRGLPPLLVGALTFGLALPTSALPYLSGVASAILGVAISFGCRFMVGLVAFWIIDVRGIQAVYLTLSSVLCGLMIPVSWFPAPLAAVARGSPFPSMLQTPIDVLTGRAVGAEAARLIAVQVLWLAAVLVLGRWMLSRATRRLVVQGG